MSVAEACAREVEAAVAAQKAACAAALPVLAAHFAGAGALPPVLPSAAAFPCNRDPRRFYGKYLRE